MKTICRTAYAAFGLSLVAPAAMAIGTIDYNPYAFENMPCDEWLIEADTNPYSGRALRRSGLQPLRRGACCALA